MKPIIGIVAKYIKNSPGRQEGLLRDEIREAIVENGGIPIGILPVDRSIVFVDDNNIDSYEDYMKEEEKEMLIEVINKCDGIILQGGSSALKYENWIARYTFEHDIPTLGICAGQDTMARAKGGTTKLVSNLEKHFNPKSDPMHMLYVNENTKLFDIVKCNSMIVNSRHKKTIDRIPEDYIVSGVCIDGYYDVIEAPSKRFNIAVRFHPESIYKEYKEHREIFNSFIEECKKFHNEAKK